MGRLPLPVQEEPSYRGRGKVYIWGTPPDPCQRELPLDSPFSAVCLDEPEWRFNNRENPFLFRNTLLKLIIASKLGYKELVS